MWKNTSYNQRLSDTAILNTELIAKQCGFRERVHENTHTFSGISEQLSNYYDLDDFVSGRIMFTYDSHGERDSERNSKFFSGDVIIEYH